MTDLTDTINPSTPSGGKETVLLLPLDFPRHRRTFSYSILEYPLHHSLNQALRQSKMEGIKEEAFLAAVYFAWIYRLSGESEAAAEWTAPLGTSLPIFVSIQTGSNFQAVWDSVHTSMLIARPGSDGEIETRLSVRRPVKARQELLTWQLHEAEGNWSIKVEYDTSVLKSDTIGRYVGYYEKLLKAALTDASARIAGIDILSAEDQAVYERINATEAGYPREQTIHGMLEAVVDLYPDKIAVSSVEGELTYKQLNEQANQLAHQLLGKGLRKGEFVTILMERSLKLIVSLFGILKAGGVYVPIDPEHPEERNRYIVEDTKSCFILTKTRYLKQAAELSAGIAAVKEVISTEHGFAASGGSTNPGIGVQPGDLGYVIYTSGSTGRPKGALIAHEGVVNLGETVRRDCRIQPDDVLTQFATYSFDASVWDTIGALFYGATLYLLSAEERMSAEEFATAVERTGTTIIAILPTVFFNQLSAYLSEEGYRKLSKVKVITVAGEALYGEQVRAFQRKFKDSIDIVNVYGPTECTVCTTTYTVSGYIGDEVKNVPIGRPILNYKVYIVNEENRLCPVNVHGEVMIATIGLAKGYLNQPEKTAEAFVPNPFEEGGLIYRSGDIAKLLPDGTIEYVGRRDSQIKIRGHRIEIGEIEDNFAKITNLQNVAVIPKKDKSGQNMLVGYFTSMDGHRVSTNEIKRILSEKLPSYFIPKRIVQLTDMPLSSTGKLDRKKLSSYAHHEEETGHDGYLNPENEHQSTILAAWREGLDTARVGIHDDFFEIGGDSLAIIHVLVLLKPHYPGLKINDFYQYRTVEALARHVEQIKDEASEERLIRNSIAMTVLDEHPAFVGTPLPPKVNVGPTSILLTGATGYLGSQLLYDLLTRSDAMIYCLIRGNGEGIVHQRLQKTFMSYFGDPALDLMDGRVYPIEGDLSKTGLGLTLENERLLKEKLDVILHCAADVRHFGDAGQFAKTNILGTRHLIELAEGTAREVRFHHISTLGIPEDLALSGQWERVLAMPEFEPALSVDNVYTNSKLEAEKLLFEAGKRGLAVTIYRAGNLSCHSESGQFQNNIVSNAFYRMIKAMMLLGKAPEANWEVDFTPIDYAGRSIVSLALRADTAGRVFHICNPEQIPYARLIEMIRGFGYTVETMSFAAYTGWLLDKNTVKDAEGVKLAIAQLEGDGAKDSGYRYGCRTTSTFLAETDIRCPAVNEAYIGRMISYASKVGYFPETRVPLSVVKA